MHLFGNQSEQKARVYFTGGATAVLLGWRTSTTDIDMQMFRIKTACCGSFLN
jgi:hypothetical protein